MEGRGYHWFVALRYLRGASHRWSRILVAITGMHVVTAVVLGAAYWWLFERVPTPRGVGARWVVDPIVLSWWAAGLVAAELVWMVGRDLRRGRTAFGALAIALAILPPMAPSLELPAALWLTPIAAAAIGAWLPSRAGGGRRWFVRVVTAMVAVATALIVTPIVVGPVGLLGSPALLRAAAITALGVIIAVPTIVAIVAWWDALQLPSLRGIVIAVGVTAAAALLALVVRGALHVAVQIWLRHDLVDAPFSRAEMVGQFMVLAKAALIFAIVLALFFVGLTILRRLFSFFSTVSIAGVWVGTMALVMVLSVMSGFESDLRSKILGSNAHIQVSQAEGDFTAWEAVKVRVEAVPGVVASTPFAVSEVVIAANNNYFNVIIKGIDPSSIEKVTKLMDAIECQDERGRDRPCTPLEARAAIGRLEPVVSDEDQRLVPQGGAVVPAGEVLDRAPDDMVDGTDPIDFSTPAAPPAPPDEPAAAGSRDRFGGDAPAVLGLDAEPPAPTTRDDAGEPDDPEDADDADLADEPVERGSNPDGTHTITVSAPEFSPPTRRTFALPGVLVGKELTKQIHLWEDQEVRMVSPLSDPANPDATGTPIPFNRDYRIAGTFFTGMYEYDLKYVYVTLDSLQDFLDRGDIIDGLEIRIDDPEATGDVVAAVQRALGPDYRVQGWQELNRSLFSALKLEKIAMFLVLAIIILVASFSIVGTLVMVVVEKGKEIALLKTLGSNDRGVTWIFVTQGFFIGLIGTLLGVGYGLFNCWLFGSVGIPIDPNVYYIDRLPIHVDFPSVGLIAAAGVLISVGATLYPARVAALLPPSVGLRH